MKTEPQPHITCTENFVKFGHVAFEIFDMFPVSRRATSTLSLLACFKMFSTFVSFLK